MDPFLTYLGAMLGSQNYSENGPTIYFFGSIFRTLFYEVLKLFKCLLGAFLSLFCLSWEASGPQKPEKEVFKVFANAAFWVSEPLNGTLGPILAPSWPDLVPKLSPKNSPKNCS